MSKARDILDERLARGEISEEEHRSLSEKIKGSDFKAQDAPTPISEARTASAGTSFKLWKLWPIIPILLVIVVYSSIKNNLVIENLSSNSPFFEATTVTAVVYNNGPAKRYRYWVVKGDSKTEPCPGNFFIGKNERRTIRFQCAALTTYNGRFGFRTSTRD